MMLRCNKCQNDAPFADPPPIGQKFICYGCRMTLAWAKDLPMNLSSSAEISNSKSLENQGDRPLKIGDRVRRYAYGSDSNYQIHVVVEIYTNDFTTNTGKVPEYELHCSNREKYPNRPFWCHEDGSLILPPKF